STRLWVHMVLGNGGGSQFRSRRSVVQWHLWVRVLIDLSDGILHGRGCLARANYQRDAVHQERARRLVVREIDIKGRLLSEARLEHVPCDADDRIPGSALENPHLVSERVAVRPDVSRETLADNRHRLGIRAIALLEETPLDQRNSERLEIIRADHQFPGVV